MSSTMSKRKRGTILPDDLKEKAIANGLALTTVYARLKRGWDKLEAVTIPPTQTSTQDLERDQGWLVSSDRPRGSIFSFAIYKDVEDDFYNALSQSGLTKSEFIANAMEQYLQKIWKKK